MENRSGMDGPMILYWRLIAALTMIAIPGGAALAQAVGAPSPWEMNMQPAFGPLKEHEIALHNLVLVIITAITLFVAALLVWVMWRYNARRNPVPGRLSHHTLLEVAWTVIPVLILVVIAIPSFRLVYYEDRTHDADLTVKVTAHQWYWEYTYPDKNNLDFTSYMIPDDQLKPGQLRLLTVDNEMVVPVGKNIRILTTSADVIHSFFIPTLRLKQDAMPGRKINGWFEATKPGTYEIACAELCGFGHYSMHGVLTVHTPEDYEHWVQSRWAAPKAASK